MSVLRVPVAHMTSWPHNAYVGQKVVCIDASYFLFPILKAGEIYTIAHIGVIDNKIGFDLVETPQDARSSYRNGCNACWLASRFRPIQSTETGMSILRAVLDKPTTKIKEHA